MRMSHFFGKLMLGVCVVSASYSAAFAQPPGGGRGQGGFGGGFGGRGGLLSIASIPEVQTEVKLEEGQKTDIKAAQDEQRKAMEELRGGQGGGGRGNFTPPSEESMKKVQEASAKAEGKLEDILDPGQFDRVLGIWIQSQGEQSTVNVLKNRFVADRLALSEDVKSKLKTIEEESGSKMREMFSNGGGGARDEMREKMDSLRKETSEKALALLTAEQKTKLDSLKGSKFDLPQGAGRGQGGPGGQGGGRGQGGQGGGRGNRGDRQN